MPVVKPWPAASVMLSLATLTTLPLVGSKFVPWLNTFGAVIGLPYSGWAVPHCVCSVWYWAVRLSTSAAIAASS
jgi:hypothetical protein